MRLLRYLLTTVCILLITTTFAYGNVNIDRTCDLEEKYEPIIEEICELYDVDINLVKAIIRVESAFDYKAISSNKSCRGLMQLSKGTAKKFGVKNVFDPYENIHGGVKYLVYLRSIFGDDVNRIVASYNVGEGRIYKRSIPKKAKEYVSLVMICKIKYDKRDADV